MNRIHTHIRGNAVGYLALFVALTGSAYAAGLAPDSVSSRHIEDGQVRSADVRDESLSGSDVRDESLESTDVADDSLTGDDITADSILSSDIQNEALTGTDINESTLGEVPRATIAGHGGYGRQSGGPEQGTSCDPPDGVFVTCAEVGMNPSAPGRVLVTGRFTVGDGASTGGVHCNLRSSRSGGGYIAGTETTFYVANQRDSVTLVGITDVYQPGYYSFRLECNDHSGEVVVSQARVTALVISPF